MMTKSIVVLLVVLAYGGGYAKYRNDERTYWWGSCWGGPRWVVPMRDSALNASLAVLFAPCWKLENWVRETNSVGD